MVPFSCLENPCETCMMHMLLLVFENETAMVNLLLTSSMNWRFSFPFHLILVLMPLRGISHSDDSCDEAPFFKDLDELDLWAETPSQKLNAVLPYHPRKAVQGLSSENRGRLLVNTILYSMQQPLSMRPEGLS